VNRGLIAPLLLVLALSVTVRVANHLRIARAPADGGTAAWIAADPDSLYHMRRLARALDDGGRVAPRDPLLGSSLGNDDPRGAPIPWPPYYTHLLWLAAAPFAPDARPARARFVEHFVATAPLVFSALTSVVVALAAGALAGRAAALVAGVYHACSFCALRYGYWGMGDHHAFVTLLHATLLFGLGRALASRGAPGRAGALLGALGGIALGTWAASAGHLLLVEGTLVAGLVLGGGPRVARLGAAFNLAAALAVLPAVALGAPGLPLVTLSAVQPLALALVGLGLWGLERRLGPAPGGARAPRSGLTVAGAAVVLAVALAGLGARGQLATALDWARGENTFMASISESQPLGLAGPELFKWLGWGAAALPVAWLAALVACLRGRTRELLPWVVATPPLVWLALEQRRFAEALAVPLAVLLGWGAACAFGRARGGARHALVVLALVAPVAAHPRVARLTVARLARGAAFEETDELAHQRSVRAACEWIGARPGEQAPRVLAEWDVGHALEWGAGAATVATNFGSYLGEDAFLEPWRALLTEDPGEAERRLAARDVRYVFLTSRYEQNLATALRALHPGQADAFDDARLAGTLLGRLVGLGGARGAGLGCLRLVHVAPALERVSERPHAQIWERVRGATLVARGAAPGDVLRAQLRLGYPGGASDVFWNSTAVADARGVARLRVPYTTEAPNGDARARGGLDWTMGARSGVAQVAQEAVTTGGEVALDAR
jgi:hypothetical protein